MNFALGGIRTHDSCIRGKRLSARPQGPHGRERTIPRLILKHLEIIFPQRHGGKILLIYSLSKWNLFTKFIQNISL